MAYQLSYQCPLLLAAGPLRLGCGMAVQWDSLPSDVMGPLLGSLQPLLTTLGDPSALVQLCTPDVQLRLTAPYGVFISSADLHSWLEIGCLAGWLSASWLAGSPMNFNEVGSLVRLPSVGSVTPSTELPRSACELPERHLLHHNYRHWVCRCADVVYLKWSSMMTTLEIPFVSLMVTGAVTSWSLSLGTPAHCVLLPSQASLTHSLGDACYPRLDQWEGCFIHSLFTRSNLPGIGNQYFNTLVPELPLADKLHWVKWHSH